MWPFRVAPSVCRTVLEIDHCSCCVSMGFGSSTKVQGSALLTMSSWVSWYTQACKYISSAYISAHARLLSVTMIASCFCCCLKADQQRTQHA